MTPLFFEGVQGLSPAGDLRVVTGVSPIALLFLFSPRGEEEKGAESIRLTRHEPGDKLVAAAGDAVFKPDATSKEL
ncbi:MAG: hypothetical protein Q7R39_13755 [Dehalococcoidia bacterium]|nr:hypothetical protein [Dehalococcoidia bacterium]